MDITKFNQELGRKISKAQAHEKKNDIEKAIDAWLEVSDYALRASKDPKIEFSFKSMLIERIQQIIDHVKQLKGMTEPQKQVLSMKENKFIDDLLENGEKLSTENSTLKQPEVQEPSNNEEKSVVIKEESEFKNIPDGFKEIEPSKEFKIITPHKEDFLKELQNHDVDTSIFKQSVELKSKEDDSSTKKNQITKRKSEGSTIYCFACGNELTSDMKQCPNCGTKVV
jgi:hypothetical protein